MKTSRHDKLSNQAADLRLRNMRNFDMQARRRNRRRRTTRLLLFVVAFGLPITALPSLRSRFRSRVEMLAEALSAETTTVPLMVQVGEGGPLPAEYRRGATALPSYANVMRMPETTYSAALPEAWQPEPSPEFPEEEPRSEDQIEYGQGAIEQEAYNLLLESNPTVAAMVEGSDPSMHFKTWAAAGRGDATYWVNITFTRVADDADLQYIWEVKLMSKEIRPLSSYARSLSRP